jgi:hypothetical protein
MISNTDLLGEWRLVGEGLDKGESSSVMLVVRAEAARSSRGVTGEERVLECGVLTTVLAVSSSST